MIMNMTLRAPVRRMATVARQSLKIGLIPADGIGHEVIPVSSNRLDHLFAMIPIFQ